MLLNAVFPDIPAMPYICIYTILTLLLTTGSLLPHNKIIKYMDIVGYFWACLQCMWVCGFIIDAMLYFVFVYLLELLTVAVFSQYILILYLLIIGVTIYSAINGKTIRMKQYNLNIDKAGLEQKKYKLIHISDLHLGSINDANTMRKMIDKINECHADFVFLTGDIFTDSVQGVFELEEIEKTFKTIKSRYGTYACLGNHDSGPDLARMLSFFPQSGIRLLQDEYIEIGGITIIGRTDMGLTQKEFKDRPSISESLKGIDHSNVVIVLDHQPGDIKNSQDAGVDLLLSGHTHGGQFFPAHLVIKIFFPHYDGYKKFGKMHSLVNPGSTAAVPPIRIGSRSEIYEITISKSSFPTKHN